MRDLEYCRTLSIETSTLHGWIEERWIIPRGSPGALIFEEADVARGRLILDLGESMGVNEAGVDVVIDLVDQVNSLRERVRVLMDAIRQQDIEVQEALNRALSKI